MSDVVYDLPIKEVAGILDKSDRQVRRYVKEKKLKARAVRVDGHPRLMFNTDEVQAFRERFSEEGILTAEFESEGEIIVDARIVEGSDDGHESDVEAVTDTPDTGAVKYVIDALREQLKEVRDENRDLHYQLEQRSGQVGFLQGRVETLQDELKMLMPAQKPETDGKKPWYRRVFRRG
jgi:DNA segregation ATPase FtsK/SpoIIIE-like protein